MTLLLCAIATFLVSGLIALAASRSDTLASRVGAGGAVAGAGLGLIPAVRLLLGGSPEALKLGWNVPYGSLSLGLDALTAFFLLPILGVVALAAVYGVGYMKGAAPGRLGSAWFFYNLLAAGMVGVVLARNGVLFLFAWEVMSLASFFLVSFHHERESVRQAGWTYLVATHLGTAFLLVLFILMGQSAGSLDFDRFLNLGSAAPDSAGLWFILALIGFGTKAGLIPLHVWLPEAHPAAPSHVSAVMSGVMIKTGIYGLVRMLTFLGPPPVWWAWVLVGAGLLSGLLGVIFALAQHDLKRLLAYHSVENIGIITLGLGVGVFGLSSGYVPLAVFGFAGALLHVANHALFKSLLFLGAGSVLHGAGEGEIDRLGGLLKPMPWTGLTFLTGAAAICALPPLNGFFSEFLIYMGAFHGVRSLGNADAVPSMLVIAGLALIGGLALACFVKAFGAVFLGEPRQALAHPPHEAGLAMRLPMGVAAAGCLAVGLAAPWIVRAMLPVLVDVTHLPAELTRQSLAMAAGPMQFVILGAAGFFVLLAGLILLRKRLLAGREVRTSVTWDCGYAAPSPRMQYTASSFAQPFTSLLEPILRTRQRRQLSGQYFPPRASLATHAADLFMANFYRPVFERIGQALSGLRRLQSGPVQLYVLYLTITLIALLIWKL